MGLTWGNRGSERRLWEGDDKGRVSSPPPRRLECGANFLFFPFLFFPPNETAPNRKQAPTCSKGGFFSSGLKTALPSALGRFLPHPPKSLDSKAAVLLDLPGTIITTVGGVAGRRSKAKQAAPKEEVTSPPRAPNDSGRQIVCAAGGTQDKQFPVLLREFIFYFICI